MANIPPGFVAGGKHLQRLKGRRQWPAMAFLHSLLLCDLSAGVGLLHIHTLVTLKPSPMLVACLASIGYHHHLSWLTLPSLLSKKQMEPC